MARIISIVDQAVVPLPKFKKVAAYARVSDGKETMLHSLSAQISYYSELFKIILDGNMLAFTRIRRTQERKAPDLILKN
ncbi:MAG: hypothetical protein LBP36_02375 [Oscillospiraceae bacterium]|jgi:hypothetical protein|nr:hypothetical protein [Oscillospiraceae bacterium]